MVIRVAPSILEESPVLSQVDTAIFVVNGLYVPQMRNTAILQHSTSTLTLFVEKNIFEPSCTTQTKKNMNSHGVNVCHLEWCAYMRC